MSQNSTQVYSGVFGNKMDINIIDLGEVFWNRQVFCMDPIIKVDWKYTAAFLITFNNLTCMYEQSRCKTYIWSSCKSSPFDEVLYYFRNWSLAYQLDVVLKSCRIYVSYQYSLSSDCMIRLKKNVFNRCKLIWHFKIAFLHVSTKTESNKSFFLLLFSRQYTRVESPVALLRTPVVWLRYRHWLTFNMITCPRSFFSLSLYNDPFFFTLQL